MLPPSEGDIRLLAASSIGERIPLERLPTDGDIIGLTVLFRGELVIGDWSGVPLPTPPLLDSFSEPRPMRGSLNRFDGSVPLSCSEKAPPAENVINLDRNPSQVSSTAKHGDTMHFASTV